MIIDTISDVNEYLDSLKTIEKLTGVFNKFDVINTHNGWNIKFKKDNIDFFFIRDLKGLNMCYIYFSNQIFKDDYMKIIHKIKGYAENRFKYHKLDSFKNCNFGKLHYKTTIIRMSKENNKYYLHTRIQFTLNSNFTAENISNIINKFNIDVAYNLDYLKKEGIL